MTPRSLLFGGTLIVSLGAWSGPVQAAVIEATFAGVAVGSRIYAQSPFASNFDGDPVTGTFSFDTDVPAPAIAWPNLVQTVNLPGTLALQFFAAGQTTLFRGLGTVTVSMGSNGQEITFEPEVSSDSPYHYSSLVLTGPLLDGLDISTFRPGPVDLAHSSADFFDSRDFGSSVVLTSFTFTTPSIPEPGSWALMLAALGLACGRRLAPKPGARNADAGSRA